MTKQSKIHFFRYHGPFSRPRKSQLWHIWAKKGQKKQKLPFDYIHHSRTPIMGWRLQSMVRIPIRSSRDHFRLFPIPKMSNSGPKGAKKGQKQAKNRYFCHTKGPEPYFRLERIEKDQKNNEDIQTDHFGPFVRLKKSQKWPYWC